MGKRIVFTNLGTVKTDTFEYSYDSFIQLMNDNIMQNIDRFWVEYYEKEDCYIIRYDERKYEVMCGKEK